MNIAGEDSSYYRNYLRKALDTVAIETQNPTQADLVFRFYENDKQKPTIRQKNGTLISRLSGSSKETLTVKSHLYEKYHSFQFIPKSIIFESKTVPKENYKFKTYNNIMILKPTAGWKGKGITRVQNNKQVADWVHVHPEYTEWTLQDYIEPVTIGNHKFHVRIWLLITQINNRTEAYLCKKNKIILAKKPYKHSDFDDSDIHDTHANNPDQPYLFYPETQPDHWTQADLRLSMRRIRAMLRTILKNETEFRPDYGFKNGYEIFGLDVLFEKTTKKPMLLEFNDRIGYDKERSTLYPSVLELTLGKLTSTDFLGLNSNQFEQL